MHGASAMRSQGFVGRARVWKGFAAVVSLGSLIGGVATLVPLGGGSAGATASAAPACPTQSGSAVPFSGALTGGNIVLGKSLAGTNLGGSACGLLTLTATGGTIDIPAANFSFNPETIVAFGFLKLPSTITVDSDATGALTAGSTPGTFDTQISVTVTSTVKVLGQTCKVGPFTPVFTTGSSGSVTGSPLTGSLANLKGSLVAGDFTVPAIKASSTCNGLIAGASNLLMGLPLAAGSSSITNNVAFTLTTGSPATTTTVPPTTTAPAGGYGRDNPGFPWFF